MNRLSLPKMGEAAFKGQASNSRMWSDGSLGRLADAGITSITFFLILPSDFPPMETLYLLSLWRLGAADPPTHPEGKHLIQTTHLILRFPGIGSGVGHVT